MNFRLWAPAGAALLLGGCATVPVDTDGLSPAERRSRIEAIPDWEMRGRIAIDTGDDAYQGRFSWWQEGEALTLLIRGFLGAGSVEISGTATELTVRTRDDTWLLEDAEVELSDLLGWWVPVTSLRWWLLGMSDSNFDALSETQRNSVLERLEQRAWALDYESYQIENGLLVPRRIDLHHDTLRLVVTIDDWVSAAAADDGLN